MLALVVDSLARFLPIPKSLPMDSYFHDATSAYIMAAFGSDPGAVAGGDVLSRIALSDLGKIFRMWWQECC